MSQSLYDMPLHRLWHLQFADDQPGLRGEAKRIYAARLAKGEKEIPKKQQKRMPLARLEELEKELEHFKAVTGLSIKSIHIRDPWRLLSETLTEIRGLRAELVGQLDEDEDG